MSGGSLSVAVLISAGRHPVSGFPRACRGDAVAMALGHRLAGSSLRVVHAGALADPSLPDYLALGAGRIDVVAIADGDDAMPALAAQSKGVDLILTGQQSEQGEGSGLLPYLIAKALQRPVIADALRVDIGAGEVVVRQFLPKGKRRLIAAPFPLVVAVHPMAPVKLNYAYAQRVAGRIELTPASPTPCGASSVWTVEPEKRCPVRLKAQDIADAHDRMMSYIQTPSKGGTVAFDGSPVDKAQILLSYLREHRLIDF